MEFNAAELKRDVTPSARLWACELKLLALSHLFSGHTDEECSNDGAFLGIAKILEEIKEEISLVRERIDAVR